MSSVSTQVDIIQLAATGQVRRGAATRLSLADVSGDPPIVLQGIGVDATVPPVAVALVGATVGMRVQEVTGALAVGGPPLVYGAAVFEAVITVDDQIQQLSLNLDAPAVTVDVTLLPAMV